MKNNQLTVLVVEDEKLLLQAIIQKLTLTGLEAISAVSGEAALSQLKKLSDLPDVIWLDYHLTGMDGLAFLREIKANPKWKNIPVVVVSNSASSDKVSNMLALGANKYILKAEYRLNQIITIVKQLAQTGGK